MNECVHTFEKHHLFFLVKGAPISPFAYIFFFFFSVTLPSSRKFLKEKVLSIAYSSVVPLKIVTASLSPSHYFSLQSKLKINPYTVCLCT